MQRSLGVQASCSVQVTLARQRTLFFRDVYRFLSPMILSGCFAPFDLCLRVSFFSNWRPPGSSSPPALLTATLILRLRPTPPSVLYTALFLRACVSNVTAWRPLFPPQTAHVSSLLFVRPVRRAWKSRFHFQRFSGVPVTRLITRFLTNLD